MSCHHSLRYCVPFLFLSSTVCTAQTTDYIISERSTYLRDEQRISPDELSYDYPSQGVSLGNGWDIVREEKTTASCITFTSKEVGGQIAEVKSKRIENTDSLRQEMNISYKATAKGKFGKFSGDASAKTRFLRRSKVDDHSVSILVNANVVNGIAFVAPAPVRPDGVNDQAPSDDESTTTTQQSGRSIRLTKFARDLLGSGEATDIERFRMHCGDGFVNAIERGAELYAVYNLSETSSTTNEERKKSLSASASYMGMSASLDFDSAKLSEIIAKRGVKSIEYYHSAHRGLTLPSDEQGIYNSLAFLGAATSLEDSFPFRIVVHRYESLPDFTETLGDGGLYFNEQREAQRQRLMGLVRYLDAVIKHPGQYGLQYLDLTLDDLETIQDVLYDHIAALEKETRRCFEQQLNPAEAIYLNCLSKGDRIYWDWPYRAVMPIHIDLVRALSDAEAQTIDGLTKKISNLEALWNSEIVNVAKRPKKCPFNFGRGGICGHWYEKEGCAKLPNHATCRQIRTEQNRVQIELATIEANAYRVRYTESRYLYWIKQASRERRVNREIGGYLSNQELEFFRQDMMCQDPEVPDGGNDMCVDTNEPNRPKKRTLQDRILAGERLRLALSYNSAYRDERTKAFQAALKNDYLLASQLKLDQEKRASDEAFINVFGVTIEELLRDKAVSIPNLRQPDDVLKSLRSGQMLDNVQPSFLQGLEAKGAQKKIFDLRRDSTNKDGLNLVPMTSDEMFAKVKELTQQLLANDRIYQDAKSRITMGLDGLERSQALEATIKSVLNGQVAQLELNPSVGVAPLSSTHAYDSLRTAVLHMIETEVGEKKPLFELTTDDAAQNIGWERLDDVFDWQQDFDLVLEEVD
ncbi:hypothetical protein [Pelagibius sp. Alg239-R121]|uniref:hypothetical protein n=1 Tax=Pelagibius sp. Alg239-R121 TaxID=2993448 RepID=UPI0024A6A63E|nr:hypothetical protein [Pelagibius sp. Alg239-R121]